MRTHEYRNDWRLTSDPPPDGWRRGAQWFRDDGTLDVLYTNAPENESPFNHEHVFVNYTPVRQARTVGSWYDLPEIPA